MKFAFMIMGDYDSNRDYAIIENGSARIIGVRNVEEACTVAKTLLSDGVDCIELCGAFNENAVREIIATTDNSIPIGYITHLPEQDEIYAKAFSL